MNGGIRKQVGLARAHLRRLEAALRAEAISEKARAIPSIHDGEEGDASWQFFETAADLTIEAQATILRVGAEVESAALRGWKESL